MLIHGFHKYMSVVRTSSCKEALRFYHATAKKFLRFPGLKLKRPAISCKKNFFLWMQKELLAHALFLGCTVHVAISEYSKQGSSTVFSETVLSILKLFLLQSIC